MSGFMSNTLLIRFPIKLSVYIVYRMHKVERRMVKTNAIMCRYLSTNDLVYDGMK